MGLSRRSFYRAFLGGAALAGTTLAGAAAHARDKDDALAAREAVQDGEILPLAEILRRVRGKLPGDLVGVELERKRGAWEYEFKVVDDRGRLFKVHVNARDGAIRRIEKE